VWMSARGRRSIRGRGLQGFVVRIETRAMTKVRLQKVLAQAGIASRRGAEEVIRQGRVVVNGIVVTELGVKVDPHADRITVDRITIAMVESRVYLLLFKPRCCVTTARDPQGRKTVFDFVPDAGARLFPVGRLDFDAEGLLLLTNDGLLANRLQHPRYGVTKTYEVAAMGHPTPAALERLRTGVMLKEGMTAPAEVTVIGSSPGSTRLRIVLHQGWNRQIKRMGEAVGHPVLSIKRVAFGPLRLGSLKPGGSRHLKSGEVELLYKLVHLDKEQRNADG